MIHLFVTDEVGVDAVAVAALEHVIPAPNTDPQRRRYILGAELFYESLCL